MRCGCAGNHEDATQWALLPVELQKILDARCEPAWQWRSNDEANHFEGTGECQRKESGKLAASAPWVGQVILRALPGAGFHRKVRVAVQAKAAAAARTAADFNHGTCRLVLAQYLTDGMYIDIDEIKGRHDFAPDPALLRPVRVLSRGAIDIERPAMASTPHVVGLSIDLRVHANSDSGALELPASLSLPVHLRYPRLSHDGSLYATVEMPPPLAYICCAESGQPVDNACSAEGGLWTLLNTEGAPPAAPVTFLMPAGQAADLQMVMYGTAATALVGCAVIFAALLWKWRELRGSEKDKKER